MVDIKNILSPILVTRQEINRFRIRRSSLLDKLFTIPITITQKWRLPDDATWLVCRLLILSWAGFFCSQLGSVRLCSELCSVLLYSVFSPVLSFAESESYVTTDSQSASLSWNKASICGLWPDFYYCQTVAGLSMWGRSLWGEDETVVHNCCWP
jgi:hypothetical protein